MVYCPKERTRLVWRDKQIKKMRINKNPLLSVAFPELYSEIDFSHPENRGIDFEALTTGNAVRKIWWKHTVNGDEHKFDTFVSHRVRSINTSTRGCRFCKNRVATRRNSIVTTHPAIANDWDYGKNPSLDPTTISAGSERTVWWRCPRGHEDFKSVANRVRSGGCTKCRPHTSLDEIRLLAEARSLKFEIIHRFILERNEIDVYFPSLRIGIELDGIHHQGKEKRDRYKEEYFERKGVQIFRLRDHRIALLRTHREVSYKKPLDLKDIKQLFALIYASTKIPQFNRYCETRDFMDQKEYLTALSSCSGPPATGSLAELYPDIAQLWGDTSLNGTLLPKHIGPGSRLDVFWKHLDENGNLLHHFPQKVKKMVAGAGCSLCNSKKGNAIRSLAIDYPELANEWDLESEHNQKLLLTPDTVRPKANIIVDWKAVHNGELHRWSALVASRVAAFEKGNNGCSICANLLVTDSNRLSTTHPEIAREWDYEANKSTGKNPDRIVGGSPAIYFWICPKCGSSYPKEVRKRTERGQNCPYCSSTKRKVNKTNCLSTTHPILAQDWADESTTPDQVTSGSGKTFRFVCRDCGEESNRPLDKMSRRKRCNKCGKRYDAGSKK